MLGTLTADQIEQRLHAEVIGRIGCYANGRTYVVPITYGYDGECIYGHSMPGLKIAMMRANPNVCFQVDHRTTLADWESVIAWGRYEELSGNEARHGMAVLMGRFMGQAISETGRPRSDVDDVLTTDAVVYRIRLTEKTGRFERS
jgi:nitroimidazol reductase NimA-like FMN-containing flavoprotein (pyridoxamine 5'-phosphate oxidase superfamily)